MTIKHPYHEILHLFNSLYMDSQKSCRTIFIREGLKFEYGFTEDELCLIWQAFDMATEHWIDIEE